MNDQKVNMYDVLIDRVIADISIQLNEGNTECISELLSYVPRKNLIGFLPEGDWKNYKEKG
jgi:hypothetical protein